MVACDDGKNTTVVYASYRDLGRRSGVSHSLIADYAKKHNCMRRREVAQARIEEKTDQKLVELRATARAVSKDDELRIIDNYLVGFEKALSEGRVRFDNPGDFNTMVRLKEFVHGGANPRQEVHAVLSPRGAANAASPNASGPSRSPARRSAGRRRRPGPRSGCGSWAERAVPPPRAVWCGRMEDSRHRREQKRPLPFRACRSELGAAHAALSDLLAEIAVVAASAGQDQAAVGGL